VIIEHGAHTTKIIQGGVVAISRDRFRALGSRRHWELHFFANGTDVMTYAEPWQADLIERIAAS
jgi:hypothetical protein